MAYRWIITADHISNGRAVGVYGPRSVETGNNAITSNQAHWAAYDDDEVLYYEGEIFGDYTGFEPLDDYAMPVAGCTGIKLHGRWL